MDETGINQAKEQIGHGNWEAGLKSGAQVGAAYGGALASMLLFTSLVATGIAYGSGDISLQRLIRVNLATASAGFLVPFLIATPIAAKIHKDRHYRGQRAELIGALREAGVDRTWLEGKDEVTVDAFERMVAQVRGELRATYLPFFFGDDIEDRTVRLLLLEEKRGDVAEIARTLGGEEVESVSRSQANKMLGAFVRKPSEKTERSLRELEREACVRFNPEKYYAPFFFSEHSEVTGQDLSIARQFVSNPAMAAHLGDLKSEKQKSGEWIENNWTKLGHEAPFSADDLDSFLGKIQLPPLGQVYVV